MRNFMSDSPRNKTLAGPWMAFENAGKPRPARPRVSQMERMREMVKGLTELPGDLIGIADVGGPASKAARRPAPASVTGTSSKEHRGTENP